MRVVFAPNILVSALIFPGGHALRALERVTEGRDVLLISRPIIDELLRVPAREFARDAEQLSRLAVSLAELGETVEPGGRINILKDDPDDRILECAQAGIADAIVTGDHAMLALRKFGNCRVLRLRAYLAEP
ncbi:MAG TPA: putative toxin-antitoxin system toxin component, PIN family [Candidatus Binataceae bacterium]|nr:putative toxin-antitoxin system toxin component, PIN family [Candidatus Binataceae bacterium]